MESLRNLIKKNQAAVIGLVVLAGLFVVYNTFIKSEEGPDLISEARGIRDLELGREIIVTLNKLKTIQIDTGILDDPRFQKLQDFSEPLPQYAVSKNNPFQVEVPGSVQTQSVEIESPQVPVTEPEEVVEPVEDSVDASEIN